MKDSIRTLLDQKRYGVLQTIEMLEEAVASAQREVTKNEVSLEGARRLLADIDEALASDE